MADLSHWDIIDLFGVMDATALIAGIDPADIGVNDNWKITMPINRRMESDFQIALQSDLLVKPSNALKCWWMESGQPLNENGADFNKQKFSRNELARWLIAIGQKSSYQFDRNRSEPIQAPSGRWPWGNHHTELLGHLEAAARRYWQNYDPADATTAPTNKDVAEWLITERKLSQKPAESIASMLRPDGLPTGPRK